MGAYRVHTDKWKGDGQRLYADWGGRRRYRVWTEVRRQSEQESSHGGCGEGDKRSVGEGPGCLGRFAKAWRECGGALARSAGRSADQAGARG